MSAKRDPQRSQRKVLQRGETGVPVVQDISLSCEGSNEEIHIRPPNLSAWGMFISTARSLPEGAVLSLRYKLAHIKARVQKRCEVRHAESFLQFPFSDCESLCRCLRWSTLRRQNTFCEKALTPSVHDRYQN